MRCKWTEKTERCKEKQIVRDYLEINSSEMFEGIKSERHGERKNVKTQTVRDT